MIVRDLETYLLQQFPRECAESWDVVGLTVGDPSAEITGVACALEAGAKTIRAAVRAKCNVVLSHHPAYLQAPLRITPQAKTSSSSGATVFTAVQEGVSLLSLHTNLDKSIEALEYFAELFGYPLSSRMQEPDGYGAVLDVGGASIGELARRCANIFGTVPVVWGSHDAQSYQTVFSPGSFSGLVNTIDNCEYSTIISGECSYHMTRELYDRGLNVILVGHDASEWPYASLLKKLVQSIVPRIPATVVYDDLPWHVLNIDHLDHYELYDERSRCATWITRNRH